MSTGSDHPLKQAVRTASVFEQFDDADILALIAEYPLAWVMPQTGDLLSASLLPLVARTIDGQLRLIGHLARRNPLAEILRTQRRATLLFSGPQDYISPALVSSPQWAPTWNYAQLRIAADVTCEVPDIGEALQLLTDIVEASHNPPWEIAQMGDRYEDMSRAIMPFTCTPTRLEGRFKLGQDESLETLKEIIEKHPNSQMVEWMKRLNADRLG